MHKLVTKDGWEFNAASYVKINGKYVDLDDLTQEQQAYIATALNIKALNAAYAGKREYRAEGLPAFRDVFPESGQTISVGEM